MGVILLYMLIGAISALIAYRVYKYTSNKVKALKEAKNPLKWDIIKHVLYVLFETEHLASTAIFLIGYDRYKFEKSVKIRNDLLKLLQLLLTNTYNIKDLKDNKKDLDICIDIIKTCSDLSEVCEIESLKITKNYKAEGYFSHIK